MYKIVWEAMTASLSFWTVNPSILGQLASTSSGQYKTSLTAKTGEAGIEIARKEETDLILLDIHLPDLHGLEVLKLLRAMDKTKNTPVIAISANAMPQDIKQALNAGFHRYLKKPINIKEMLEVIDDTLNVSN